MTEDEKNNLFNRAKSAAAIRPEPFPFVEKVEAPKIDTSKFVEVGSE